MLHLRVRLRVRLHLVPAMLLLFLVTSTVHAQHNAVFFKGSADMVLNPERGFRLELDQGCDDGPAAATAWAQTMADATKYNITVVQTYCYLATQTAVSAHLSQDTLGRVERAFSQLRNNSAKALFRFAYDRAMPGTHDYTPETILGHIDQLQEVVEPNVDALYALQAGFIGSWGEWHSSKSNIHANASAVSRIVEAELFTLLPSDRKMQVRVPVYKLAGALRRSYSVTTLAPPSPPPAFCAPPTDDRTVCPGAFGGINISQCTNLDCCFFVNQTKPGPQCYTKTHPWPQQVPIRSRAQSMTQKDQRMAFGIASESKSNTAVARIGFDNDGFMSTATDGGSWGGYTRGSWQQNSDGDSAPFPRTISELAGSLATPTFQSEHGPMLGPDFEYAKHESAYVPIDGEMFWFAGASKYDANWPEIIPAETAAWRLREMHYSTLSFVHGFLDGQNRTSQQNETIARWMRTPLDVDRLRQDRLPISEAYASTPHTGFEYIRDHLGYRLELRWAQIPATVQHGAPMKFGAGIVNWGFAAPINPRPVLLVLLSVDSRRILWRSTESLADVRDWQPHEPGDPTYSILEHLLSCNEVVMVDGSDVGTKKVAVGLFMPDARMARAANASSIASRYSIRLANDQMGWVVIPGEGAVNVIGQTVLK